MLNNDRKCKKKYEKRNVINVLLLKKNNGKITNKTAIVASHKRFFSEF